MTKKLRAKLKKELKSMLNDAKIHSPKDRIKDVYVTGAAFFIKINDLNEKDAFPLIEEVWKLQ